MDRFSETSPADLAKAYAASLFGEETPVEETLDAGDENAEVECPIRAEIVAQFLQSSIAEYLSAMNAHEVSGCIHCSVSRKEVSSETRSEVGPIETEVA